MFRRLRRAILIGLVGFGAIEVTAILLWFPWSVDDQADPSVAQAKKYYQSAYEAGDRFERNRHRLRCRTSFGKRRVLCEPYSMEAVHEPQSPPRSDCILLRSRNSI